MTKGVFAENMLKTGRKYLGVEKFLLVQIVDSLSSFTGQQYYI